MRIFIKILVLLSFFFVNLKAYSIETKAISAYVIDVDSNTVLLDKNSDIRQGPASMSKLMITYMAFERLKDGTLDLSQEFLVSKKAWKFGGSKMFVNVGNKVSVDDLLKGIIVQSGNDACIVLAEGISGSEENMVDEMNLKAKEIGLTNTNFTNVTGWPENDHYMSLKDIGLLSKLIIEEFPEYYHYFAMDEFTYNDIQQFNRNKLINVDGYDGLKTGRTSQSGYGIVASAKRENRRVISVVNGLDSNYERQNETKKLVNWAFRDFKNFHLYNADDTIHKAKVWLGKESFVPLTLNEDLNITVNKKDISKLKIVLTYEAPIIAPIKKGDKIAEIIISNGKNTEIKEIYSEKNIEKINKLYRSFSIINYLLFGVSSKNE